MSDEKESPGGIVASLRRILDGGLAIVQKRVEHFAVELREEKCRLVEAIILASAVVVFVHAVSRRLPGFSEGDETKHRC